MIDGITNFVLGVKQNDKFRFKVFETHNSQGTPSPGITVYKFQSALLPYDLTVVDVPGHEGVSGLESIKQTVKQVRDFLSERNSCIDQLHGIAFVAPASLTTFTTAQKCRFDMIMSVLGNDIEHCIFVMTTSSDASQPPVLDAVKAAKIPYREPFKFNNGIIFASNESRSLFDEKFWEMNYFSYASFFATFSKARGRSLALTREGIREKEQLEALIPKLHEKIRAGLSEQDMMAKRKENLQQHNMELRDNQGFTYFVDVTNLKEVPLQQDQNYTTACLNCKYTCHKVCGVPDNDSKANCSAMDSSGYCTECPNKCHWTSHKNIPCLYEYHTEKEARIKDDVKRRHDSARSNYEKENENIKQCEIILQELRDEVCSLIRKAHNITKKLEEIALKPDPLSDIECLDKLIETEQQEAMSGWEDRVDQYRMARKEAELIKMSPSVYEATTSKEWWHQFNFVINNTNL